MYFLNKKSNIEETKEEENKKRLGVRVAREQRVEANMAKLKEEKQRARVLRKERELAKSQKAMEMYNSNMDYQLFHEKIVTIFADLLKADIQCLNSGEVKNISLAGKWCPIIDSSYDKVVVARFVV